MKSPKVSVIMPVYNGENHIKETIDSILSQTFQDFEYIIVDDASTDSSLQIIKSYEDPRIILIQNEKNIGQTLSRNKAIDIARGDFIALTDADDISHKNRLEIQTAYMDDYRDIALCGTWAQSIGEGKTYTIRHVTDPEDIRVNLLFRTSLTHSTIMIRKEFIDIHSIRYNTFSDGMVYGEDFELYTRISLIGKIANIPRVLLSYRRHDKQVTAHNREIQIEHVRKIITKELHYLGIEPTEKDIGTLISVKKYLFLNDKLFLQSLSDTLKKIAETNKTKKIYNQKNMEKICGEVWLETSNALSTHKNLVWHDFWDYSPRKWIRINPRNVYKISRLFLRYLIPN